MTIAGIMNFYEHSNADVMQALDGETEGILWTLPSCSPDAVKQVIRQLIRCKATRIKWVRRIRLNSKSRGPIDAIAIFILPDMEQSVFDLASQKEIRAGKLRDSSVLAALAEMHTI